MNLHFNDFTKKLNALGYRYDLSKVFNDLLTMGICSFHRTNIQSRMREQDPANEAVYLETIKPYRKEELKGFAETLAILQLGTLDSPCSDILGSFFERHISQGKNGQFFTPGPVCELMARIQTGNERPQGKRILDPACGSGRMLLAAAKLGHKNHFFGADNDPVCAKMATLNFFLNGLTGEVSWMDSLGMEWYGGWHINTQGLGIVPITREQSLIWCEAPKPSPPDFGREQGRQAPAQQLTLF